MLSDVTVFVVGGESKDRVADLMRSHLSSILDDVCEKFSITREEASAVVDRHFKREVKGWQKLGKKLMK